jgi:hypothetical protein
VTSKDDMSTKDTERENNTVDEIAMGKQSYFGMYGTRISLLTQSHVCLLAQLFPYI